MSTTNSFLFCMVLTLSLFFIKTSGYASPINLTLVDKPFAVSKGALCLDGSPPGYHFDKGFEDGVSNWLVFLEVGAWCNTTEYCSWRTYSAYGNSSKMEPMNFTGILDKAEINNPKFFNWNKVLTLSKVIGEWYFDQSLFQEIDNHTLTPQLDCVM